MDVILVTGAAGFIGAHVALRLLQRGERVIGIDNLNDYYDVALKRARLAWLREHPNYTHLHADVSDRHAVERAFDAHAPGRVIHLAAQTGVRHATRDPHAYVASNVTGFLHVLEGCRTHGVAHLVFASSSSVYGGNTQVPFSEHRSADHPLSLYGASKKANEAMAHSYAHLYRIPCTGLRLFTVYGPWGRPDMAPMLFAEAILSGRPLPVFNRGRHRRSFTFIDDIADGVLRVLDAAPAPDPHWDGGAPDPASSGVAPYRLYNIGHERSVELLYFIRLLERHLGREAKLDMLPLQAGDVLDTAAEVSGLAAAVGHASQVPVEEGVARFAQWYLAYARP